MTGQQEPTWGDWVFGLLVAVMCVACVVGLAWWLVGAAS